VFKNQQDAAQTLYILD